MKKLALVVWLIITAIFLNPAVSMGYDFGDYRSVTLASKAWAALEKSDIEGVLAYTNKCIELYGEQAKKMQAGLKDYVLMDPNNPASKDAVFANWALNDVATSLFIQGEAYRRAKMNDEAKEVYQKLIKD